MRKGFTLVELMVVIAIIGLLVSVLATATLPKLKKASSEMDKIQMKDCYDELVRATQLDEGNKRKLHNEAIVEKKGYEFWEAMFRNKILGSEVLRRLVSKGGSDTPADSRWLEDENGHLPVDSVSWTAPRTRNLFEVLKSHGKDKAVLFSFNGRNWNNYPDAGVLVLFAENEVPEYVTPETLKDYGWELSPEEWQSPSSLFGQKRPFDGTWE
jgi:prepilin-type N-terminal cleavage/methylation domain-containing protein